MIDPRIYASVFINNPDGRLVMEELSKVFFDHASYTKGDHIDTAYNEGSKAVFYFIQNKIKQYQKGEITNE